MTTIGSGSEVIASASVGIDDASMPKRARTSGVATYAGPTSLNVCASSRVPTATGRAARSATATSRGTVVASAPKAAATVAAAESSVAASAVGGLAGPRS